MATRTTKKPKPAAAAKRTKLAAKKTREPRAKVEPGVLVPIQTFAPEPYDLARPILVLVQPYDHEYTATLVEANLTACGVSMPDAVDNLKDLILATYENFSRGDRKLGPYPTKQLAVLRDFITKRV